MDSTTGRLNNGFASGSPDNKIISMIMLRFRPIAPKLLTNSSASVSNPPEKKTSVSTRRINKRKYVKVKTNVKKCIKKIENNSKQDRDMKLESGMVTLQLLPETGGVKCLAEAGSSLNLAFPAKQPSTLVKLNNLDFPVKKQLISLDQPEQAVVSPSLSAVESWVMVDRITNISTDGGGLGLTDMEKMKKLETDTCPGLISDRFDGVQWVNLAYRRMVDPLGREDPSAEMVVWLVVKDRVLSPWPAFACTVRVVYTWRKGMHSQIMPCDVWKMDSGGFAWRLDANAALSLGQFSGQAG